MPHSTRKSKNKKINKVLSVTNILSVCKSEVMPTSIDDLNLHKNGPLDILFFFFLSFLFVSVHTHNFEYSSL